MEKCDLESKLIDEVKERKVLFDKSVDGYRNKLLKRRGWEEISANLTKFQAISSKECQSLWNNLRNQFMAYHRKTIRHSGDEGGNQPYFRHSEAMAFLRDKEDSESTLTNFESTQVEENVKLDESVAETSTAQSLPGPSVSQVKDHRAHTNKKRRSDPVETKILQLLESTEDEDDFATFGKLIASKLRKIDGRDKELCLQTQQYLQQLIYDAERQMNGLPNNLN